MAFNNFRSGTKLLEDRQLEDRQAEPIPVLDVLKQTERREAITGVDAPASVVGKIAEPALKDRVKQVVRGDAIENRQRSARRKQAFSDKSFDEKQKFEAKAFADTQKLEYRKLDVQKEKQSKALWGTVIGVVLGVAAIAATAGAAAPAVAGAASSAGAGASLTGGVAAASLGGGLGMSIAPVAASGLTAGGLIGGGLTGASIGGAIGRGDTGGAIASGIDAYDYFDDDEDIYS